MDELIEELKRSIIDALKMEGADPTKMDADQALFGGGFGLDSIDALELVVMLEKKYGIRVPDRETGQKAFASLRSLAAYVSQNRKR